MSQTYLITKARAESFFWIGYLTGLVFGLAIGIAFGLWVSS